MIAVENPSSTSLNRYGKSAKDDIFRRLTCQLSMFILHFLGPSLILTLFVHLIKLAMVKGI